MLDQISRQLASADSQIATNLTPPLPYPPFHASASDRRVNIFWLISLICSLSAALLATLVQQWYRAYMRILQQSSKPLKTARIRQFLLEGLERLPRLAEAVPALIHVSLILFFWGLGDLILQINTAVFVSTVVPIAICVFLYLYCVIEPIWKPQSPYRTPFSGLIWRLIRILHLYYNRFRGKVVKLASMEVRQEQSAMEEIEDRKSRDVRAVRWLVDNINGSNEVQTVLAVPGSFNQECGRDVWKGVVGVVSDDQSTLVVYPQTQTRPGLPSPREGTTVYDLCRYVRYLFETYSSEGAFMDTKERRRRMRGCVETAASLVCCTNVELDLFGEVGEVLSDLGDKERANDPLTIISNPLFAVRWTCLSLVAIKKMVDSNKLQERASFALDGIARFQTDYGGPDTMALTIAQKIDDYLKKAWELVVEIHLAFDSWSQNRTESEIRGILNGHKESISELARIAIEVVGVEDVDWRISLFQDTMDEATHKLTRHLPGVFFSKLKPAAPITMSEAFDFPSDGNTPVPPQLISFPGQQIQSLCTLGRRLRDIIEGQNTERHAETLKSLGKIPALLHRLNNPTNPMKRQRWRLMDLRDGGGLGFTMELFFLALRPLLSTSLSSKLEEDFYTGTFWAIRSNWEESKNSDGTLQVLLNLLCDLVIRNRGVFSDFPYPPYIVGMFLALVKKMVEGHRDPNPHINDAKQELEDDSLRDRMDNDLRDKALSAIRPPVFS
jgi:hypothetical protein